jgi:hypothetical protein
MRISDYQQLPLIKIKGGSSVLLINEEPFPTSLLFALNNKKTHHDPEYPQEDSLSFLDLVATASSPGAKQAPGAEQETSLRLPDVVTC